jgi:histone acetyltransferase (RNA polymerase elongator complex component)
MRIARTGTDFITLDEDNLYSESLRSIPRVHLIKLMFFTPSEDKIKKVLSLYPKTNRFIIEDNIKTYNNTLKWTNKKYYVENKKGDGVISFFKKNNKVILNFLRLNDYERDFLIDNCLEDVLRNLEVVVVDNSIYKSKEDMFNLWNGNVIIDGNKS